MRHALRVAPLAAAALGLAALLAAVLYAFRPRDEQAIRASLTLEAAMAADSAGFARASTPRTFDFPADHGPHPDFATEWWYFTGNVRTADGRRFGYELTFFRKALASDAASRSSDWAADQAFMAHLAITDVRDERFLAHERFARGAAGLAGARTGPLRIWLYDWRVESTGADAFPVRITAADSAVGIELELESGKPPVLQGERGLSRKGPEPGNASYYYSLTRLPTHGTLRIDGDRFEVEGTSWMDREWSTSALSEGIAGWDWFALQLDDSTELMLYQLRHRGGGASIFSGGSFVAADGTSRTLSADAFDVAVLGEWRSPRDGTRYPARWRVRVPALALDVTVAPVVADQELNLAVRYWEGAVDVAGTRDGRNVAGVGYVELTGYAQSAAPTRGR